MSTEEVKIYTTFDSFDGQYIGILMGHMTTHEINIFVPDEAVDQAIEILTKTGFLEEKPEEE